MIDEAEYLREYLEKLEKYSVSLSSFQVFLGLKKDLMGEVGVTDAEIFYQTGYDIEANYTAARNAEVERGGS